MSNERQETVADIVAAMRDESHAGDGCFLEWVGEKMRSYADRIEAALKREKAKPVRNCDKHRTAKEAFIAFEKMCQSKSCDVCPFSAEKDESCSCRLNWLYAEADK